MNSAPYIRRRNEIRDYFDRTALDAWKRLTGTARVSGVRATVRAGRDAMRASFLSHLPADLSGWRILDAGCGGGQLSIALAARGADVLGIDLSPQMIEHARKALPDFGGRGSVTFASGDMLAPEHGSFDAVVAMDSLIHYPPKVAAHAVRALGARTRRTMLFTLAPRTPLLSVMHAVGKAFPRGDRSPSIEPVAIDAFMADVVVSEDMAGWRVGAGYRVTSGFYISHLQEVARR